MTEDSWHPICELGAVPEHDLIGVEDDGCELIIVRLDGDRHFVLDGRCTHGKASLAEGFVVGDEIECPKHNGRFDVATGDAIARPVTVGLGTYHCRVRDGKVEIRR